VSSEISDLCEIYCFSVIFRVVASEGPEVPVPPIWNRFPPVSRLPPGCCIHPTLYFKNVPLLVFGPLLLNLGDGPGYFASHSSRIKFSNYFFDVCCVNWNILVRCQVPTTSYSTEITLTILVVDLNYFSFPHPNQTLTRHTYFKHGSLSTDNKFCQRIWCVECYSVHVYME